VHYRKDYSFNFHITSLIQHPEAKKVYVDSSGGTGCFLLSSRYFFSLDTLLAIAFIVTGRVAEIFECQKSSKEGAFCIMVVMYFMNGRREVAVGYNLFNYAQNSII
jgi:hypothetical protein